MSVTLPALGVDLPRYEPTALPTGPILVASDASADSDAAFPVADAVASHTGASVHAVSVIVPFMLPMYGVEGAAPPYEISASMHEQRQRSLVSQMHRLVAGRSWSVEVFTGEPARDIAQRAHALNARVIVAGRGRHTLMERLLKGETVLRMLQFGDAPVLAVAAGLTSLPREVVIGTDFSACSVYAARVAISMIAADARVHLVHVAAPFVETDVALRDFETAYRADVASAFAYLRDVLHRDGVTIDSAIRIGNPSDQLVKVATERHADLLVTSTHGYGFVRRMVLGSVAASVLRNAPCSILCVPGSARRS